MGQVSPDDVAMLTAFGRSYVGGAGASVLFGRTCCRRSIARDGEPCAYRTTVASLLVIGGMCLFGIMLCPRG